MDEVAVKWHTTGVKHCGYNANPRKQMSGFINCCIGCNIAKFIKCFGVKHPMNDFFPALVFNPERLKFWSLYILFCIQAQLCQLYKFLPEKDVNDVSNRRQVHIVLFTIMSFVCGWPRHTSYTWGGCAIIPVGLGLYSHPKNTYKTKPQLLPSDT